MFLQLDAIKLYFLEILINSNQTDPHFASIQFGQAILFSTTLKNLRTFQTSILTFRQIDNLFIRI